MLNWAIRIFVHTNTTNIDRILRKRNKQIANRLEATLMDLFDVYVTFSRKPNLPNSFKGSENFDEKWNCPSVKKTFISETKVLDNGVG